MDRKALRKCMRKCKGDPACMKKCETKFRADGGSATVDGGKVFRDPDGKEAFVTDGGKVF
jgi:hypothetical protein